MSKPKTRELHEALEIAGASRMTVEEAIQRGREAGAATSASGGRRRGYRENRTGVAIYLPPETHHQLKLLAVEERMSIQELCKSAIVKLLDK